MPITTSERNYIADQAAARYAYVSLHTGDPGTNGANEVTGGAYARQALVFSAATGGTAVAAEVTFDVPAGTYTHFGVWTAATGGTFRGGNPLSVAANISPSGQINATVSVPVTAS